MNGTQRIGPVPIWVSLPLTILALLFAEHVRADQETLPPGSLDAACATDCAERGHDGEYCARICWVPTPSAYPANDLTDLRCLDACRESGGRYGTCKRACKRN